MVATIRAFGASGNLSCGCLRGWSAGLRKCHTGKPQQSLCARGSGEGLSGHYAPAGPASARYTTGSRRS